MKLQRDPIRDQIKRVLLSRILDGTYHPGDRLIELQIAREMSASQGSVREAFRELEALRLLESEAYRGTRVRGVNAREMAGLSGSGGARATRGPVGRFSFQR